MYFQDKSNIQLDYYSNWKKPINYSSTKEIFRKLHPYQFVKEGDTVFTVGCQSALINMGGSQPLIYSSVVGDSGKVIVIEPDPTSISSLTKYINTHNITNIEIVDKAIWDENIKLKFNFYDGKIPCGVSSIREKISGVSEKPSTIVDGRTLDSLIDEYGKPDFINLTINGSEYTALRGLDLGQNIKISIAMVTRKTALDPGGKWSAALFDERLKKVEMQKIESFDAHYKNLTMSDVIS